VIAGGTAGLALGIDADGALLLRDAAQRVVRVTAGEVVDAPRH
jgi:biotin-(acetyl-CoA carboxylase) ligase